MALSSFAVPFYLGAKRLRATALHRAMPLNLERTHKIHQ
jgi:hypothetical protein